MEVDEEVDVKGKVCPMPLIALNKQVGKMEKNRLLRIIGDDPLFEEAVLDFCKEKQHEVLENKRDGRKVSIVLRT